MSPPQCAVEGAKPRSPSLRSAWVLTGLYSAFAIPVLERLGYGAGNMRLISRDAADRTTVSLPLLWQRFCGRRADTLTNGPLTARADPSVEVGPTQGHSR
jgi:hypothetical protein